jgi:hypothetical protein
MGNQLNIPGKRETFGENINESKESQSEHS